MKKNRFWRLQLLSLILLTLIVASWFGGPRLVDVLTGTLAGSVTAQPGVLERTFSGHGIMVRSEVAVTAPTQGNVTLLVQDGQRVRAGQLVAEIREDTGPQVTEALRHLDDKVVRFDQESHQMATEIHRTLDQLELSISELEGELSNALAAGLNVLADDLSNRLKEARNEYTDVETEFANLRSSRELERENLLNEREAILAAATSTLAVVRAASPGVVSFAHDGFEGVFVPGEAPETIWTVTTPTQQLQTIEDGMAVSAGSVLFRLIDNFQSHVFVRFDDAPELRQGQAVWLRWRGITSPGVRGRVTSIHNRENQVGVWFSIDVYEDRFGLLRELGDVTVVTNRTEGIVLPKSVLGQRGEHPGLFLLADGSPVFRSVNVLASDGDSVVVDRVPAGSVVVLNPRRLFREAKK